MRVGATKSMRAILRVGSIDGERASLDARGVRLEGEQTRSPRDRSPGHARGDDQQIGDVTIDDVALGSVEAEAMTVSGGDGLDAAPDPNCRSVR